MCGSFHLGRADADAENVQSVIPRQDSGTATDAASHIQHPAAGGELVQTAPSHQLVDEGFLGFAEVAGAGRGPVMTEMDMLSPELLQQTVFRPGVVGGGDTLRRFVAPVAAKPQRNSGGSNGAGYH